MPFKIRSMRIIKSLIIILLITGFEKSFAETSQHLETDKLIRPQNPQKPYPYFEKDTIYFNRDSSIQYGATLTLPKSNKTYPAVILVSGSGQQETKQLLIINHFGLFQTT